MNITLPVTSPQGSIQYHTTGIEQTGQFMQTAMIAATNIKKINLSPMHASYPIPAVIRKHQKGDAVPTRHQAMYGRNVIIPKITGHDHGYVRKFLFPKGFRDIRHTLSHTILFSRKQIRAF